MTLTIQLPGDLEQRLRAENQNLDPEMTEAVFLELFRRGRISHYELSQALGLDRFETNAYLQKYEVYEGSLTMEDLDEQARSLAEVLR